MKRHGIISALLLVVVEILCSLFVFAPLQHYFGMWGLVATELGILLLTVIFALIFRVKPKELIPFKRIEFSKFAGVALMWVGTFLLTMVINLAFFFFFPEGMNVGVSMNDFFSSWSGLPLIFVVAVMPAICEESMHRGFIQSGIGRRINNKWVLCIIMGILFGIFHLDFYRFLGTAILGGVMSYIMCETGNFFYNMQFHFMNNFIVQIVSTVATKMASPEMMENVASHMSRETLVLSFSTYCIIGFMAPFLLLGGALLLKGSKRIKEEGNTKILASLIFAGVSSLVLLISGMMLMVYTFS